MRFFYRCLLRVILCAVFLFAVVFNCLSVYGGEGSDIAGAEEFIVASLYDFSHEINIEEFGINKYQLLPLFTEILKDDPYLFFVSTSVGYQASLDGEILKLYPTYNMTNEEYILAKEFCDRQISSALTLTAPLESEADIALYLHDYLCLNFSYDESLTFDNMYSFLKEGQGTCQGYTYTYMAMLRAAGLECTFAASDSMSHIWNLVKVDGEWYHVDVTWDDYPEIFASCEYDSFLKSDQGIKETAHVDWYSPNDILCVSETYAKTTFDFPLLEFQGTGDVNCDGVLDVLDLVLCKLDKDKIPINTLFLNISADMDGDCALTDIDFALIRKKILD